MGECTDLRLQYVWNAAEKLIESGKWYGFDEAAKMLDHYLHGESSCGKNLHDKNIRRKNKKSVLTENGRVQPNFLRGYDLVEFDSKWLLGYAAIGDAERILQRYLEYELTQLAVWFSFEDQWGMQAKPFKIKRYQVIKMVPDDLFFATGNSGLAIGPTNNLKIFRDASGTVKVSGNVRFAWYDKYDWDKGWDIPPVMAVETGRWVTASDLARLSDCGARDFLMGGNWTRTVRSSAMLERDLKLFHKKFVDTLLEPIKSKSGGSAPAKYTFRLGPKFDYFLGPAVRDTKSDFLALALSDLSKT